MAKFFILNKNRILRFYIHFVQIFLDENKLFLIWNCNKYKSLLFPKNAYTWKICLLVYCQIMVLLVYIKQQKKNRTEFRLWFSFLFIVMIKRWLNHEILPTVIMRLYHRYVILKTVKWNNHHFSWWKTVLFSFKFIPPIHVQVISQSLEITEVTGNFNYLRHSKYYNMRYFKNENSKKPESFLYVCIKHMLPLISIKMF